MNRAEQFDKNLELARRHLLRLLNEPPERWPRGHPGEEATVIFYPEDDPELARANLAARKMHEAAQPEQVQARVGIRPPVLDPETPEPDAMPAQDATAG